MLRISDGRDHPRNPFVGARPFGDRDRPVFFGRGEATAELLDAWRGSRLTVLHGECGVGKSSLLRAAAVPALTDTGAAVLPVGTLCFDPAFPAAVLPEQNPYTRALIAAWDPVAFPSHSPGTSIADFLRSRADTDRHGGARPLFAALDQTEVLLRGDRPGRRRFVEEILAAAETVTGLRLLVTTRTDHLDGLRRLIDKYEVDHTEVGLGPLAPEAGAEAARRTLAAAGTRFGRSAADRLVEAASAGAEDGGRVDPVLFQVLGRLLCEHGPGPSERPGADADLSAFLARSIEEAAAEHLVPPDVPHAWLRRVVAAGREGVGVPDHGHRGQVLTRGLVHGLQDRHLVAAGGDGYVLRHPRLARPLMALYSHAGKGLRPWSLDELLGLARAAHTRGEHGLAREHALRALRSGPRRPPRTRALLTSLLGDVAFAEGDHEAAAGHYAEAATLFEALGEDAAVARVLVAQARSHLVAGHRSRALGGLTAAANRVHGDPSLSTGIGQALWRAGQGALAREVLDGVFVGTGATSEARRTRAEVIASSGRG
ncbi:ATP-binding protein [Nocardiopsis sp. YSL2]|uniref:nSTAND1 domain-containing NTPase n=1 Tax=Nocardiopsis sp. YSL2 TaxID=2939492 RepID=UPI0026F40E3D|nr:ATP-binding protein [Nocardiopsis sp. YSL2]